MQSPRPSLMVRSASQGGPGPMGSKRTRSKRGSPRDKMGPPPSDPSFMACPTMESALALKVSENGWVANSATKRPQLVDMDSSELVERKVKALLITNSRWRNLNRYPTRSSRGQTSWKTRRTGRPDAYPGYQACVRKSDERSDMIQDVCTVVSEDDGADQADCPGRGYQGLRVQPDLRWSAIPQVSPRPMSRGRVGGEGSDRRHGHPEQTEQEGHKNEEAALYSEEYYAA